MSRSLVGDTDDDDVSIDDSRGAEAEPSRQLVPYVAGSRQLVPYAAAK